MGSTFEVLLPSVVAEQSQAAEAAWEVSNQMQANDVQSSEVSSNEVRSSDVRSSGMMASEGHFFPKAPRKPILMREAARSQLGGS